MDRLELLLMDLNEETEAKLKSLAKTKPNAPITFRIKGQLEMLEKIQELIEELKG